MMKKNLLMNIVFVITVLSMVGCTKTVYKHNSENIKVIGMNNNDDDSSDKLTVEKLENMEMETVEEIEKAEDKETVNDGGIEQEKVDLIMFMGQSNMAGYGGDKDYAPVVDENAGLEFRSVSDPHCLHEIIEPFGKLENNKNGLEDTEQGAYRGGTLVSSFINVYHRETGRKIIAVSASAGGMAMDLWLIKNFWDDCVERYITAKNWLGENGYEVEHSYIVWYQGESDISRLVPVEEYEKNFNKFMTPFLEAGIQQVFLIVPYRSQTEGDVICDFQKKICEEDSRYSLGSDLPSVYDISLYSKDNIHYNQEVLNAIGEDAGSSVANYTKSLQ